ncbi:B12-binding domain-containing radical SAM protein [bacterium]|nr:B12-binding domain-containing radical SAM protein [bacterium]
MEPFHSSRVILVQPPIEDFYLTKKRTIPYGLASIAASIQKNGFSVEILDALATNKSKTIAYPEEFTHLKKFYGEKDITLFSLFHEFKHFGYSYEYIATQVREKQPFVVGISSLFTAYCNEALKTARTVKKFYPDCKIVLGGYHPTQFPEKVLECSAVDFVLRGEGETSMALLCKSLKNNPDLKQDRGFEQIPGIAFKKNRSFFISNPSWIKDLNTIPLPLFSLIKHNFYKRKNKTATVIVSSRGCPMQCSYCSVSSLSNHAPFRQRSIENVIQEIKAQIKQQNIGFIDFEDENLCLNKQWFLSLFSKTKQLLKGENIELRAMNGLYPPSIDEDVVLMMKESGFKTLNLSLGSTSKEQLDKFKRRDVRPCFERALKLAQRHNLESVSYIIAAAPGQSAQTSLEDLLYLAKKKTLIGLSIYYPAPGSLDYQLYADKNIFPEHFSLMRSSALPLDNTTSRTEAVTLLRLARILNFMKSLKDTDGTIPEPRPFVEDRIKLSERQKISKKLLQYFLDDGIVRGADTDGRIYSHLTDSVLTQQFIKKIKSTAIAGFTI